LGVDKDGQEWYQITLGGSDGSTLSGAAQAGKVVGPSFSAHEVVGVIDAVLPEPSGGNHWAPLQAAATLKEAIQHHLAELGALSESERIERRYAKFRRIGRFLDAAATEPARIA
jgi:acetyl-CoA carboxylase carboxyl transferase subunit alpha